MAKLFTHHDPYHIHAMCGLAALLHFIHRLRLIFLDVDSAGFGRNLAWDAFSMVVLALPNVTSYVFAIVSVKKKDGFSIWKEYRDHAFVYAAKLWLFIALLLYAKHFQPEQGLQYENYYRIAAEFGTMLGLHYVTKQYPKQTSSTIRGMYQHPLSQFIAGFLQFMARATMFYGTPDPRDMLTACFLALMIIQLNAFNMTLRKKRIISPEFTQAFYSCLLGSGLYLMLLRRLWQNPPTGIVDPRFKFVYLGLVAYACRRHGVDRFTSWIVALSTMKLVDQHIGIFDTP